MKVTPPSWFVWWQSLSWVETTSAFLALAVALSVVRLVGMGAGRMKRPRTSDSVVGYMPQRLSRHHKKFRQSEKAMVYNERGRMFVTSSLQLFD